MSAINTDHICPCVQFIYLADVDKVLWVLGYVYGVTADAIVSRWDMCVNQTRRGQEAGARRLTDLDMRKC